MKKMATLVTLIALGLSSSAFAQNPPPVPPEKQTAQQHEKPSQHSGKAPQLHNKKQPQRLPDKPARQGKKPPLSADKKAPDATKKPLAPQHARRE